MTMDNAVLKIMEQYDFNSKINITMIFEDSDDDGKPDIKIKEEPISESSVITLLHTKRSAEDKTIKSTKKVKSDEESAVKDNINNLERTKQVDGGCKTNENIENIPDNDIGSHINNSIPDKATTEKNNVSSSEPSLQIIQDSIKSNDLDILCDHLVTIISAYYNMEKVKSLKYGDKKITDKAVQSFSLVKHYCFRSVYNLMVSIILPQENNIALITTVIDKIIQLTTLKKILNNTTRRHVEPFLVELISWTKREKKRLKTAPLDKRDNGFRKKPAQKHDLPSYDSLFPISINQNSTVITPNPTCIFSTTTADGREIRINTSPGSYAECNRVCNYERGNIQNNQVQENNNTNTTSFHNSPNNNNYILPPPNYNSVNPQTPQQSPNQHYWNHAPPPTYYQYHTYNGPIENQKVNYNDKVVKRRKNPTNTNANINCQAVNLNVQIPRTACRMCGRYLEHTAVSDKYMFCSIGCQLGFPKEDAPIPVISNVHSLNPNVYPNTHSFCSMCGKYTEQTRISGRVYCSLLCYELSAENHRTFT